MILRRRKKAPERRRMDPTSGRLRLEPAAMCGTISPRVKMM